MGLMSILGNLGLVENQEATAEQNVVEQVSAEKETENKTVSPSVAPPATQKKQTTSFSPIISVNTNSGAIVGKFDNDIFEKLSVAIDENNIKGNDFLEFMQSLNKMSNLKVDENTKFNMVFATLSTSDGGMTKDVLLNSIQHYVDVVENEKVIFTKEMKRVNLEKVEQKESNIEQLLNSAQEKAEQIQKLNQEIQELNETVATTQVEVAESKVAIAQKQADFEITAQQLVNQISDYKVKIEQHIN